MAIDIKPQSEGGMHQADMTMIYDRDIKNNISKSFSLDTYSIMNIDTGGQK